MKQFYDPRLFIFVNYCPSQSGSCIDECIYISTTLVFWRTLMKILIEKCVLEERNRSDLSGHGNEKRNTFFFFSSSQSCTFSVRKSIVYNASQHNTQILKSFMNEIDENILFFRFEAIILRTFKQSSLYFALFKSLLSINIVALHVVVMQYCFFD